MTLATQVGNADIYKAFDYNLGEQYKSVVSRVNLTDPYKCDKYGDLPDHLRPGYMVPLIQAFTNSDYLRNSSEEKIVSIFRQVFTEECQLQFSQVMNFCASTGELVYQGISLPLWDYQARSVSVLDSDSKVFLGFSEEEEALDRDHGQIAWISAYSNKHHALRHSHLYRSFYKDPKTNEYLALVTHRFYKTNRESAYRSGVKLCANAEDRLSNFKPRYTSLDKVFFTSSFLIAKFERQRKIHNTCVALFPKNKAIYDKFYDQFLTLNEANFNSVRAKVEQIIVTSEVPELEALYQKRLSNELKYSTRLYLSKKTEKNASRSLKDCDFWLGGAPSLIGENLSKYWYDIDYVKSISIH